MHYREYIDLGGTDKRVLKTPGKKTLMNALTHNSLSTRILALSGLGSLGIHGLVLAMLMIGPQYSKVQETIPTVQVNLVLPSPESGPPRRTPTKPLLPSAGQAKPPLPIPPTPMTSAPSFSSIQASLPPPPSPALPQISQKPDTFILKDSRASKLLEARNMMKMASSRQPQRTFPSEAPSKARLPRHSIPTVAPLISSTQPGRFPTHPQAAQRRTLMALPPQSGGGTITRPTILTAP